MLAARRCSRGFIVRKDKVRFRRCSKCTAALGLLAIGSTMFRSPNISRRGIVVLSGAIDRFPHAAGSAVSRYTGRCEFRHLLPESERRKVRHETRARGWARYLFGRTSAAPQRAAPARSALHLASAVGGRCEPRFCRRVLAGRRSAAATAPSRNAATIVWFKRITNSGPPRRRWPKVARS